MKSDEENQDLSELMGSMRDLDAARTPAFASMWRAAERQHQDECHSPRSSHRGFLVTFAGVMLLSALLAIGVASRHHRRQRTENDLATFDSTLLTYWQAPTDVLLTTSGTGLDSP